ncbi:MAG: hypothetical protein E7214_08010 [Clostridium sp.]|nr:hypothetical protein [Clostridium sp.]
MTELIILCIFSSALLSCVITNVSILYALVLGLFLFFTYGLLKKHTIIELIKMSLTGITTVKNILLTFILIGIITALWRLSGTIPFIIYYATTICTPAGMVIITFLICCLVSFLTGTSLGSAATVGVICMTMANSMGISPIITGGAILSGIYFGDRCSPMSTSALLISELTKTDIFKNINNMIKTSIVPFTLSCIFYFLIGMLIKTIENTSNVRIIFAECFNLHPFTILPALIILILSLFKLNVKITMSISIIICSVIAIIYQDISITQLLNTALFGYSSNNSDLAALLNGGGILSMTKVFLIVCISSCYFGLFNGTGFLNDIKNNTTKLSKKITPFGGILLTSIITGLISCNQSLTIMLTKELCEDTVEDKYVLASHLENTTIVIPAIIPWSIACAVPLSTIAAPTTCILTACYLYLLPIWNYISVLYKERIYQKEC